MFLKEKRAQVSVEYLLTIIFAIVLVAIVTVFALNISKLGDAAKERIGNTKSKYFENIFG
jgi:uncharacterized protein (UPF0333 family)